MREQSDNNKGTELTPKLSTDMVSSPWKLLVETLLHGFLTPKHQGTVLAA
jgi:hypothetical protein